jgi:hypothetical protein
MASAGLSSTVRILITICLTFTSFGNAVISSSYDIPLFDYEKDQLTDGDLAKLLPQDAALIAFDDSAVGAKNIVNYPRDFCKSYPGDLDWPSNKTWNKFHNLVDNGLISTIPAAAPCYQDWGVYDKDKCTEIEKNYGDMYFQYVSVIFTPKAGTNDAAAKMTQLQTCSLPTKA